MVYKERLRFAQQQIRKILLEEWDPIGVRTEPRAQDEYDFYISGVYKLLVFGATDAVITEHLRAFEQRRISLPGQNQEALSAVAASLMTIVI